VCFAQAFTIQGWPVLKRPGVAGFEAPNDTKTAASNRYIRALKRLEEILVALA
jgi:hypothetical protein